MKTVSFFVKTWLLVGLLDILAAFISFYLSTGKSPLIVLKFISSAVMGAHAYNDGVVSVLLGLVLHFVVAFLFTLFFFLLYKPLRLYAYNTYIIAIVYGSFIWLVMNRLVLPLTSVKQSSFQLWEAAKAVMILVVMIGLPLAFRMKQRYRGSQ
jgi:hypothetical protein